MEIAIHYDPARGFEEPALLLARRLFARYDEAIASLALVPDPDDELSVYLNGTLVHSVTATGRLPKLADLGLPPAAAPTDDAP